MAQKESVGSVQLEAELNTTKLEHGLDAVKGKIDKLDQPLRKTEQGMQKVEKASASAGAGLQKASIAAQAFSTALGFLGLQSIAGAIHKLIAFGKEVYTVTLNLQAIESQARAVFGDAFPKMQKQAELLGHQFNRSSSDILKFMAGFGDFLDQLGMAPSQTQKTSAALAEMTVQFGKLKQNIPDDQIFEALQQGLAGNYKALRQLDILIKDDTLQQYANSLAIKNKVKDMDSEQVAIITTMYLQDQLMKRQQELAASTGEMGDAAKTASGEWQDLQEELGTSAAPLVASALHTITAALKFAREHVDGFKLAWRNLLDVTGVGFIVKVQQAGMSLLSGKKNATAANTVPFGPPTPDAGMLDTLNRTPRSTGGGGGGGGESLVERQKKAVQDLEKAEQGVIQALGEEAKANLDNLNIRKKELGIRKDLGLATDKELAELDRVNRRVLFHEEAVDRATKAWEKQKDVVQRLKDEIQDINDDILNTTKDLEKRLKDIDKDTEKKKVERVAELLAERAKIFQDAQDKGGRLTGEAGIRLDAVETELKGVDESTLLAAGAIAGETDLQRIDRQGEEEKAEARLEAEEKLVESRSQLANKTKELEGAENDLKTASNEVVTALNALTASTDSNFTATETRTKAHVKAQIEELNKLAAAYRGVIGPKAAGKAAAESLAPIVSGAYADGGVLRGPGTDRSDNLLIAASPGERIISAQTNRMYNPILEMIHNRTFPIPKFADGGVVNSNNNNSKEVRIENHYHGLNGRRMGRDDMMEYYARKAMR